MRMVLAVISLVVCPLTAEAGRTALLNFGVHKSGVRADEERVLVSRKAGFAGGIGFEMIPQSDWFLGIAYNRRGAKISAEEVLMRLDAGYVDVFTAWRAAWTRDEDYVLAPFFIAGFFCGIESHCGLSADATPLGIPLALTLDCDFMAVSIESERREFLYGSFLGAGIKFRFSNSANVCFDITYTASRNHFVFEGVGGLSQFALNMAVEVRP